MSSEGRTVLITGANRGIGLALTRVALAQGDNVIATARDPGKATDLNKLVAAYPGCLRVEELDVTAPASVAALRQKLADISIDILINNAGVIGPERQSTLDMDFDGFTKTLAANTLGPLRVVQALLESLRKASRAAGISKIATISSAMGRMAYAKSDHIAYRASKTALNKIMQGLATDLETEKIAVCVLHPGWVRTDMGGPDADIDVATSAEGLYRQMVRMGMPETGSFLDYNGEPVPW